MSAELNSIRKSVFVYEIEGVVESMLILERADGYKYVLLATTSGEQMALPLPIEAGGAYRYPVSINKGERVAVRSFIVPAVDKKTGATVDSKRYVFADPDKGEVTLANVPTEDEYLASEYPDKPKFVDVA